MPDSCVVPFCGNKGSRVFPVNKSYRKKWMCAVRRTNWEPTRWSKVCHKHFTDDDFIACNTSQSFNGLIYGRGAWNVFGILFLTADVSYKCDSSKEIVKFSSEHSAYHSSPINSTESTLVTAEWEYGRKQKSLLVRESDCNVVFSVANGTNITKLCTSGWVYSGESEFESTIVSEFDLVCVRAYLSELSTTIFMVGSTVGTLLIAPLADKYGRRLILLVGLLAQAVVGICVTLSPNYAVFTTLRFIVGFFNMGISLTAYVMLTEIFPARHRTVPCCGFQIFWAFGIMLTAFFGFMIRNWHYLQLVLSLPNILFALFVWFLPESLPWLISQKRISDAQSVVERIAKINGIDPPKDLCESEGKGDNCEDNSSYTTNHYGEQPLLPDTLCLQKASLEPNSLSSQEFHEVSAIDKTIICNNAEHTYLSSEEPHKVTITNESMTFQHKEGQNGLCYIDMDIPSSQLKELVTVPIDKEMVQVIASSTTSAASDDQENSSFGFNSIFILCRGSRIRLYSIIIFYLFFVNSLSYFGISLSTPVLHGNQFLNLFLLGAVEIPAYIICVFVCNRFGRKVPLCVFLLLCGAMNITAILLSEEARRSGMLVAFVMLGKFAITGSYTTVYLYAAEIFPTSVRNHAIGISSFFENLGGIAAPFIVFSAKSIPELPMILFGVVSIIGGAVLIFMPETHRQPMPQTTEEIESRDVYRRKD